MPNVFKVTTAGLLISGGRSERMGRPKALLDLGGQTFLGRILANLLAAGVSPRIVVAGSHADLIEPQLPPEVALIRNPNPDRGMFSSIQCGLEFLSQRAPGQAVLICLVDHPAVAPSTYEALVRALRSEVLRIVRPRNGGRSGHPILLSPEMVNLARRADPRGTLRDVLRSQHTAILDLDVEDPAIHWDVDTPEDYATIATRFPGKHPD